MAFNCHAQLGVSGNVANLDNFIVFIQNPFERQMLQIECLEMWKTLAVSMIVWLLGTMSCI